MDVLAVDSLLEGKDSASEILLDGLMYLLSLLPSCNLLE